MKTRPPFGGRGSAAAAYATMSSFGANKGLHSADPARQACLCPSHPGISQCAFWHGCEQYAVFLQRPHSLCPLTLASSARHLVHRPRQGGGGRGAQHMKH